ncbi:transcription initiation factor TFIID subunit 4-like [Diretmus argenteus]
MPANEEISEPVKSQEACRSPSDEDSPIQVRITEAPTHPGPAGHVHPSPPVPGLSSGNTVHTKEKNASAILANAHQPASATPADPPAAQSHASSTPSKVATPGPHVTPSPVLVVAKVVPPGVSASGQLQFSTKPPLTQMTTTPGRTLVITVPRTTAPQPVTVAPRLPQTASPQFPANIQIPPGMVLIRSDTGQLMLVSQQALAQAQQGPRAISGQKTPLLAPQISVAIKTIVSHVIAKQVSAPAAGKKPEKLTVIRVAAPPSVQAAPGQKTTVVKVIGVSPKPAVIRTLNAVANRGAQPCSQTGITEASTPKDPPPTFSQETLENVKKCKNFLVTLIKLASSDSQSAGMASNVRGLVRSLLEGKLEPEEFTEKLYQELKSTPQPCLVPFLKKSLPAVRHLTADPQFFIQQASIPTRNPTATPCATMKHPNPDQTLKPTQLDPSPSTKCAFKASSGSYKEDDDINDVASMAGVNLREENARNLTTMVGSVVQSCQDCPFLSPNPLLARILHTGEAAGVTDVGPEVVALISHATQELLRGLLEKLTVMAGHRKTILKDDLWHNKVSDMRSQLRFLEEVEGLKKRRKDEEERERLMRLARSRSNTEDPQLQQLKQRAKELQQIEEAQLQHREANLTALAAIGPRRRLQDPTGGQVSVLPRLGVLRATRITLRDLLLCMEQDRRLRHSLTLYKAMIG